MLPFEEIKRLVDIKEAARAYGVKITRNGKAFCPFHNDGKVPNMSFKAGRFKCFSCGAGGDVLDFVGRLYNLDPIEAAKRLNEDFRLGLELDKPQDLQAARRACREREQQQAFAAWIKRAGIILGNYCITLHQWAEQYAPRDSTGLNKPHPLFLEAVNALQHMEYLHQAVFVEGSFTDKAWFYQSYGKEIEALARRLEQQGKAGFTTGVRIQRRLGAGTTGGAAGGMGSSITL